MFCSMSRYFTSVHTKKEKCCAYISLYKRRNNYTRYPLFGSSDFRRLTSVTFFCLHYIIQSKRMNITIKKVCVMQTQNCSKLVPSPKYPTFFLYEMGNNSEVFQLLLILYTFLCCLIIFLKNYSTISPVSSSNSTPDDILCISDIIFSFISGLAFSHALTDSAP